MNVVVLGCGFTGERVARRFINRGAAVTVTTRQPARLQHLAALGATVLQLDAGELRKIEMPPHALVLHSIPPAGGEDPSPWIFGNNHPARVVYLSTTGVYGDTRIVDEHTPANPGDAQGRARLAVEEFIAGGPWSFLVLRPAAIYGPGRGVHTRIASARPVPRAADVYVSRIHVDDLAAHVEAGLLTRVEGRFPVADEEPCTSQEIAEFCAGLYGVDLLDAATEPVGAETRRANRRVDGSAIRQRLGLELQYPSYKLGIPAAIEAEQKLRLASPASI